MAEFSPGFSLWTDSSGKLIGGDVSGWLRLLSEARVVHPNWRIGAILAPPLNDLLEKGVFRPGCKEMTVEVSGLRIKQDEDRHRGGFG